MSDASQLPKTAAPRPGDADRQVLERLIALSEAKTIQAASDIFAASGIKLLTKGAQLQKHHGELLAQHKLARPLESSIEIGGALCAEQLHAHARHLLASSPRLKSIIALAPPGIDSLEILQHMQFDHTTATLLTVFAADHPEGLDTALVAALVAITLALRLQCSPMAIRTLCSAALLHDIGVIYLDPALSRSQQPLDPGQRHQLSAHPVVAQAALVRMGQTNPQIAICVSEHHERLDGSGYPRGMKKLSLEGQILSVADLVCGALKRSAWPLHRAEIAMKLVAGEFDRDLIAIVATMRAELGNPATHAASGNPPALDEHMQKFVQRMARIVMTYDTLDRAEHPLSDSARSLLVHAYERFGAIQRAFSSTGLDACGNGFERLALGDDHSSEALRHEMLAIIEEIDWRLDELSHQLDRHCAKLEPREAQRVRTFAAALAREDIEPWRPPIPV